MNKINYQDIDFNELIKLNIESSESIIYVDKKSIFKNPAAKSEPLSSKIGSMEIINTIISLGIFPIKS